LLPFHLQLSGPAADANLILADPAHTWHAQHAVWHDGALDRWRAVHDRDDGPRAAAIMGYYTRADLPVHYALAQAFTICDNYFSSVLGPTGPNRLYWMSATLDPDGLGGGPMLADMTATARGSLDWTTFPERLEEAGVSWKVYNTLPPGTYSELSGMLRYFRRFQDPESTLHRRGLDPRWPGDFEHDVRAGTLPAVSWIIPSVRSSEHPNHPPAVGAETIMSVLSSLVANPRIWERTALIVSYDENGGFFDHVSPPTPPPGTPGEYVLRPSGDPSTSPIGLGFRVPCLVISPYSRGGHVNSETFDHTSQLRLLGRRFGVDVPYLSPWRRRVAGDMTHLLDASNVSAAHLTIPTHTSAERLSAASLAKRSFELKEDR
jgi:phospholipase C